MLRGPLLPDLNLGQIFTKCPKSLQLSVTSSKVGGRGDQCSDVHRNMGCLPLHAAFLHPAGVDAGVTCLVAGMIEMAGHLHLGILSNAMLHPTGVVAYPGLLLALLPRSGLYTFSLIPE